MKRAFVILGLCLLALLVVSEGVFAQVPQAPQLPTLRVPRISQGAKVTQVVGMSEVTIYYHRPGVKGREIWGKLLPYGEVWRAGANEPTLFTFSDEVTIEGKKLPAGTYRFVVIPTLGDWTVIFNSEVKNWGTVYEAKYDTLRFSVTPQAGPHEEWMSFSFTDLTANSARVVLAWEKVRIGFKVEFNTLARLQASVGTWQLLSAASRFALDNNMYFPEAISWIDRALAIEKNANTLRTKAELLAKAGKREEAITAGDEALKIFKAMDQSRMSQFQKDQFTAFEKLVADWKSKK